MSVIICWSMFVLVWIISGQCWFQFGQNRPKPISDSAPGRRNPATGPLKTKFRSKLTYESLYYTIDSLLLLLLFFFSQI